MAEGEAQIIPIWATPRHITEVISPEKAHLQKPKRAQGSTMARRTQIMFFKCKLRIIFGGH